jgi:hypothetical protein
MSEQQPESYEAPTVEEIELDDESTVAVSGSAASG